MCILLQVRSNYAQRYFTCSTLLIASLVAPRWALFIWRCVLMTSAGCVTMAARQPAERPHGNSTSGCVSVSTKLSDVTTTTNCLILSAYITPHRKLRKFLPNFAIIVAKFCDTKLPKFAKFFWYVSAFRYVLYWRFFVVCTVNLCFRSYRPQKVTL